MLNVKGVVVMFLYKHNVEKLRVKTKTIYNIHDNIFMRMKNYVILSI